MYAIGIDVGSTFTKYCALDAGSGEMSLFSERTPIRQREHFADRLARLRERCTPAAIVSCGYGRKNVAFDKNVSELVALAAGAARQCPEQGVVLDIGGQDTKLIRQQGGKLKAFFLNEKCAAGCGLFLGNTLNLLQMDFAGLDLTGAALPQLRLSSTCAVFAQTEIVNLIAENVPEREIALAVLVQILTQAKGLLAKVDCEELALSGGLSRMPGIAEFAGRVLERRVVVPESGAYLSAIGCAQFAARAIE